MKPNEGVVSPQELQTILQNERLKCEKLAEEPDNKSSSLSCKTIWDGILCWSSAYPKQILSQQCPQYIAGFDHLSNATKECTENGTWYVSPQTQQEWTDYTHCSSNKETTIFVEISTINSVLIKEYLPILKIISQVGYGISLTTLIVASLILFTFRKLYCPRNTLHLHLFISFIMRASVTFLKEFFFEQGVSLKSDFVVQKGSKYFVQQINDHWECRSLTAFWQYFIMANYSWILMEGLYIHNLLMFALVSDGAGIFFYIVLGWGLPLIFVFSWAIVRVNLENDLCWTTNTISQNFLILRVPIIISILLNFGLFLNIVRLLLLKVRSSVQEETQRYWRWAKSTLILSPLFGVHYTIFLGMSYSVGVNEIVELIWLFCDQVFASFQGFFVAILFCFLNNEVQCEVKKKWKRLLYQARVTDKTLQQRSFASWPSSYSITYSQSIFTLCHPFASKSKRGRKESKQTVSADFSCVQNSKMNNEKCLSSKNLVFNEEVIELQNFISPMVNDKNTEAYL